MSRSLLADLRHLTTLKRVRTWLGLSLSQTGELCKVKASSVADWQSGHRMMADSVRLKLGEQIANRLTRNYHREIGVRVTVESTWRVTAWVPCVKCGAWFELRHSLLKRCPDCRKHDTTNSTS